MDGQEHVICCLTFGGLHLCEYPRPDATPELCVCAPGECVARGISAPVPLRFPDNWGEGEC